MSRSKTGAHSICFCLHPVYYMSNILILKKIFSKLTAIILSTYKDYQIMMHVLKKGKVLYKTWNLNFQLLSREATNKNSDK
jgi:hypothetical protein